MKEKIELVHENAGAIADKMWAPSLSGHWFYVRKNEDGKVVFSDYLSQNTRFNPENFDKGEWVIVFNVVSDLDDVEDGQEVEALEEWLWDEFVHSDDFKGAVVYPSGE